jgi:hypothetical protein
MGAIDPMESQANIASHNPETFSLHLQKIVNKLDSIRSKTNNFSKEVVYADLLKLVSNCEKIELDFDLLVAAKFGRYLHLIYTLLIDINDSESLGYQRLLPRMSKLNKSCRQRILSFVIRF